jgi:isoleucyl-tRNA synthetase
MAREIVHRLQMMRRSAGFEIADHIDTYYQGDEYIRQVMRNKVLADYIKQETLSRQIVERLPEKVDYKETFKLSGSCSCDLRRIISSNFITTFILKP